MDIEPEITEKTQAGSGEKETTEQPIISADARSAIEDAEELAIQAKRESLNLPDDDNVLLAQEKARKRLESMRSPIFGILGSLIRYFLRGMTPPH